MDADDIAGAFSKKDSVRFYEVDGEIDNFNVSSEVHVIRDDRGDVVSGSFNERTSKGWKPKIVDLTKLYAVIRRRAVHKETLKKEGSSFARVIIFVMSLHEYNHVKGKIKDLKEYTLISPHIIVQYYFTGGHVVQIHGQAHGNAKSSNARQHSTKVALRESVASDHRAPRVIAQESTEKVPLLDLDSDCDIVRDPKQISNYRYAMYIYISHASGESTLMWLNTESSRIYARTKLH